MELEEPIKLRAKVMWKQRQGLRRYDVGLNFLDIPADVAKQLTEIALNHSLRRLLSTR